MNDLSWDEHYDLGLNDDDSDNDTLSEEAEKCIEKITVGFNECGYRTLKAVYITNSEKAFKLKVNEKYSWWPKSQCEYNFENKTVTAPCWLIEKKYEEGKI